MKFAVLDFETTGDLPIKESIIHVGLVVCEGNPLRIVKAYRSFVYTERLIPPFIQALTGISNEMLQDAPKIEEVVRQLLPLLEGAILVGHQVQFDLGFLQNALIECGYPPFSGPTIDTVEGLKMFFPSLTSYQLSAVAESRGIQHERPHQADSDAWVTALLWLDCLQKFKELPFVTQQRLVGLWSDTILFAVMQTAMDPSFVIEMDRAEVVDFGPLPSKREPQRQKSVVYRNMALAVDDWGGGEKPEPTIPATATFESFLDLCEQAFQALMPQYQTRPVQKKLMHHVFSALSSEQHVLIEAPTGTGKSLGYLLPAAYVAHTTQKKVVISTHTISLQEQLRNKELPLLQSIFSLQTAVLKGRSQYLCLRKWEEQANGVITVDASEDRVALSQYFVWLTETERGDREELNLVPLGQSLWQNVSSDAESCLNRSCPWYRKCFYHRARYEATEAQIIVTNHALLFSDAIAEHRVLPAYQHLIVDEAHHLDEVGRTHLGHVITYFPLISRIHRLDKERRSGQIIQLQNELSLRPLPHREQVFPKIPIVQQSMQQVLAVWEEWFLLWTEAITTLPAEKTPSGQMMWRLRTSTYPQKWQHLIQLGEQVATAIKHLVTSMQSLLMVASHEDNPFVIDALLTNMQGVTKDIERVGKDIQAFLLQDEVRFVYWIEWHTNGKGKPLRLHIAPIHISEMMQSLFWTHKKSAVLTSATLSVRGQFQYIQTQLGLPVQQETAVILPTPFRYDQQAMVLIPSDFPSTSDESSFVEALVHSLSDVAVVTEGRMLVLFTSYKQLKQVYPLLRERLQEHRIGCIGQGVDTNNRSKLIKQFMHIPRSVLLGTSSFWEGVDFAGEMLTCLVIVRLPFQPPGHPIQEALYEWYQVHQPSAFRSLSLPQAVIRFKQGFGRLVRTEKDRGVVLVYDTRIVKQTYGKLFLQSLPNPRIQKIPTDRLPSEVRNWLVSR